MLYFNMVSLPNRGLEAMSGAPPVRLAAGKLAT